MPVNPGGARRGERRTAPGIVPETERTSGGDACGQRGASFVEGGTLAGEEDWGQEYLDYIISIKTVKNIGEAIAHINRYNTKHSEAIITRDYDHAQKFLDEVDAAAVYVNASTRFTDGFEFGYGAEIGISTRNFMREVRWGFWHSQPLNTLFTEMDTFVHKFKFFCHKALICNIG